MSAGGLRDVRRIYDIRDVLSMEGEDKIVCPLPMHAHSNYTPSFNVFQGDDGIQRFQCHGNCGLRGDVIDLVGYLTIDGYDEHNPKHVHEAIGQLANYTPSMVPKVQVAKKGLAPNEWRQYVPPGPQAIEYARSRGLHANTLKHFKVGQYKHFMSIPIFEDGVLKMIKFRNTWPKEKLDEQSFDTLRFWTAKGSTKALFNYDAVAYKEYPFLLVKGEIPAMLLHQYGIPSCAVSGGETAYIEQWLPLLVFSRKIVVVGDNDKDPDVREKMGAKARYRAEALRAELKFPPEEFKDIDLWMLRDPSAVNIIRGWLSD